MPSVHFSAFEAGGIEGYRDQADRIGTAVAAIVERAANEATPLVVEGVHVLPGALDPALGGRCLVVEALLVVDDEELHRGHFSHRGGARPAQRYLAGFAEIRALQDELVSRARAAGVAVIDNANVDDALAQLMALVLDAVANAGGEDS
jgi:2-phosphoglycerate kinase